MKEGMEKHFSQKDLSNGIGFRESFVIKNIKRFVQRAHLTSLIEFTESNEITGTPQYFSF